MKKYNFTMLIERDEDGIYVASVPALKGCHTQANSLEKLLPRVKEVIELCLEEETADVPVIIEGDFIHPEFTVSFENPKVKSIFIHEPDKNQIVQNYLAMDTKRFGKQLNFLREIDKVKSIFRNTVLLDKSRRENDAEHSWHMAICAMIFQEYVNDRNIDMCKVLKMIMLHDIVEIYSGDTFAYDPIGRDTQAEREKLAADKLFALLPTDQNNEFRSTWDEFEEYVTPESKYAHLVDTFMPIYHNYVTQGLKWQELGVTKTKVLNRNQHIKAGSAVIWNYVCEIVDDAVAKGYLQDA